MRFTRTNLLALLLLATPAQAFVVGYPRIPISVAANSYTAGDPFTNGPYKMPRLGILQSCSFYISAAAPTGTAQIGLYSGTSVTVPATLLGATATFAVKTGWNTLPTTTHPLVNAGTILFMGAVDTVSDATVADANAGIALYWNSVAAQTVLPAAYGTPALQSASFQLGAYCTFSGDDKLPGRTR